MSCNGCRVLRKGCSDNCILRPCLQWIDTPEAQGHATVFVAKFFGRAGLMSFISAVPDSQRPALFQSLLFEAAGRTVNPVNGAVGLLGTGNWHVCQEAVETVLRGGALKPISDQFVGPTAAGFGTGISSHEFDEEAASECTERLVRDSGNNKAAAHDQKKRRRLPEDHRSREKVMQLADLDLSLTPGASEVFGSSSPEKRRLGSPSMNSEESVTTNTTTATCFESRQFRAGELKLLNLF